MKQRNQQPMISAEAFAAMALSFPGTEKAPHFDRTGFRVSGRRMFATYFQGDNTANIFLTPEEQSVFCQADAANIYKVRNKWGENGATTFVLDRVEKALVQEALDSAYKAVMQPRAKPAK